MKKHLLKIVLPAFAIFMAVGLAFATENDRVAQEAYYYIPGQGWQTTIVEDACFQGNNIPCEYNGNQLYAEPDLGSVQLRKP